MAEYSFKVNDVKNTSYFGDKVAQDCVAVMPSALTQLVSQDLALQSDVTYDIGILGLDVAPNTLDTTKLLVKKLKGFFPSDMGKHFIQFKEEAELDISALVDGAYVLYVELIWNTAEFTRYAELMDMKFHILLDTDVAIGTKLAELTLTSGNVVVDSLEPILSMSDLDESVRLLAEAINNLASATGQIKSIQSQHITMIQSLMPFDVVYPSSDDSIFSLDGVNNEISLKKEINYNFMSNVALKSTTNSTVTVNFRLIDIADDSIVIDNERILTINNGDTLVVPLNTLVPIGTPPKTIRIEVVASESGLELLSFGSILSGGAIADVTNLALKEQDKNTETKYTDSVTATEYKFYMQDGTPIMEEL